MIIPRAGEEVQRHHPYARCEECPLYGVGRYTPSAGPPEAKLAFIGEAPGLHEARKGIPFVGESGKLLSVVMKHHDIDREEVLLTNACLCRPPDNATPAKTALDACRPRLIQELQDRGVETAVALGNSAAQTLLGLGGITKLRVGPGKTSQRVPDVRVIPTFHPAAALRQADLFPYIVTDIGKIAREPKPFVEPEYIVVDDRATALQAVRELAVYDLLVVDIEVDIEKDTAYDHPNHYGLLCIGIAYARNKAVVFGEQALQDKNVIKALAELLRRKKLVAQNGKFDLAGLYPHMGGLELWFDTMIASYTFDERPGVHGLKIQAVEYLGAPQYDDVIRKYVGKGQGYGAIPRHILYKYNAYDATCTWLLREMYEEKFVENPDLRRVHDLLVAASNQFMYIELNGIAVDREYIKELAAEYIEELAKLEDGMNETIADTVKANGHYDKAGGINPRSPKQIKEYLQHKSIRVDSTNEETLTLLLERLAKYKGTTQITEVVTFVKALLKYRTEHKMYSTYVRGVQKRTYRGRVYPTFLFHGTTSGRLACRNPNLMNQPRASKMRRMYIPADCTCERCQNGDRRVFVHTDGSQMELRVLTFLAQEPYFRDIFNEGVRDLFDELTPILYPNTVKPPLDASDTEKAAWKELRIRVKAYVYGLSYGREAFSIAQEYRISEKEAQQNMNRFFAVIPEIVRFRKEVQDKVFGGEDLITPFGRHRRFTLITKHNWKDIKREALAFLPQSTASDITLSATIKIRQDLRGIGWIRNFIHDAVLSECHESDADRVAKIQEHQFLEAADALTGGYVKFATESTIGTNWGDV